MKIALAFPACHRRGGVERVLVETANFLESRGYSVDVYASEFDQSTLLPRVQQHMVPMWPRKTVARLPSYARNAANLIRSEKTDILATFGVVCPFDGVMWVPSVHSAWLEISQKQRGFGGRLRQRLNPFHYYILHRERLHFEQRRYRRLIALTADVKNDLMRLHNVPEKDIDVLPNGYSPEEFNPERRNNDRERVRGELGYAPNHKVIIFVANELERKGFGPLLRAVSMLKDPDVRLLVVGRVTPGHYAEEFEKLGLAHAVKFIGPSSDVGRYYAAADLFALPTIYEAWGLVIVEALASGLPVLTSRLAGAAVTVHEGQTGLLLDDPADSSEIAAKLRQLLDQPPADPSAISQTVRPYTWTNILTQYEQILFRVVNGSNGKA